MTHASAEVLAHEADKLARTILENERDIERALAKLERYESRDVVEARRFLRRALRRTKIPA